PPTRAIGGAVIWFNVGVPACSDLTAVVGPSAAPERRRFTIAPDCARVEVPLASTVVTTAGRPVGIAATANATAVRNSVLNMLPRARPRPTYTLSAAPAPPTIPPPNPLTHPP